MNPFILSLNVVLPVFFVMGAGIFLRHKKIIDKRFVDTSMQLVFRVCLPAMLFTKVSQNEALRATYTENIRLLVFVFIGIVCIFFLSRAAAFFIKNRQSRGAFVQGSFRSNYVIIGYSILSQLFGDAIVGKMALLVMMIIPVYNILAILALSQTEEKLSFHSVKRLITAIVTNPLIIGIALGFLVLLLQIKLPPILSDSIDMLGAIATPLGVLAIGASLDFSQLKAVKPSLLAVFLKLIFFPAIATALALQMGFSYMDTALIFIIFGSPTAISSFAMTAVLKGDSQLSANIIILSTALSVGTLILGLSIISALF